MKNLLAPWIAAAAVACACAATPAAAQPAQPAAPTACPVLLQHTFPRLQDEKPQSLCQYSGQVLLVVNTASYCGFTPQYKGLEALHAKYRGRGFAVLGFPSNDFNQEKGSNKEVADFCENTFGVQFPMFGISAVRGHDANPLFRTLAQQTGRAPLWNFYKYLVGRDGKVVAQYSSLTTPDDAALVHAIEEQLARR
ncbi:glutathione peroxidase [Ramlibacter ginsenosidimutans]|uniref:Glutathione peroxidase n=1 Tax=Ramlibacter ginsenosidimutans TaxID=502333 RepID=A0A934TS98_9BURK|nr:glutathione peroxidase [Ramlibacter ginsenosidimutans]MBK6005782.1 glutathione peroxidase [Ramlibacter ginsenosidimutans]